MNISFLLPSIFIFTISHSIALGMEECNNDNRVIMIASEFTIKHPAHNDIYYKKRAKKFLSFMKGKKIHISRDYLNKLQSLLNNNNSPLFKVLSNTQKNVDPTFDTFRALTHGCFEQGQQLNARRYKVGRENAMTKTFSLTQVSEKEWYCFIQNFYTKQESRIGFMLEAKNLLKAIIDTYEQ
jgi:hypothetical protein